MQIAIEMALYKHGMEKELDEERKRYQELFEYAPEGYLVTDLDGGIQEANATARSLLGVTSDYLVRKPLSAFVPPEDLSIYRSRLEHLEGADHPDGIENWELRLQRREGPMFHVMAIVRRVQDQQGKLNGLRWSLRDITERKQAEELILRLSTPILKIRDRLLLVPIIGEIDAGRARFMVGAILSAIRGGRARVVVIDLTGALGLDSYAGKTLADMTMAATLLGAVCVISGLSAAASQTLVAQGIELGSSLMAGDLQGAIEAGEKLL